jgi:quinol monooxygenase YgiN
MNSISLFITFDTRPEATHDFAAVLQHIRTTLPAAPGCEGVRVFTHPEQPDRFSLLERWRSVEAHRAHVDRLVASGEWQAMRAHLASEPTSFYLAESAT